MNELILIDGSSLLSTSFYGNMSNDYYRAKTEEDKQKVLNKLLKTSTGIVTNAVLPMTRTLLNILKNQEPSHIAVAWDISRDTFRRDIYPEYKATRNETPIELRSQYQVMQDLLADMNIAQFKTPKFEADDILGTLAKKFERNLPVRIMTKDQDALQLVNDYTRVWLITSKSADMASEICAEFKVDGQAIPDNTFEFTPMYVEQYYGLEPIQIVDMKALGGDTSDNIPGVKGVGDKTIVPLLREYKTVENLYTEIEGLTPQEEKDLKEFWKSALGISRAPLSYLLKTAEENEGRSAKEYAFLSKMLATIDRDMEDLKFTTLDSLRTNVNISGMQKKFRELEFKSLLATTSIS